jgi:6-phosphofructokinase
VHYHLPSLNHFQKVAVPDTFEGELSEGNDLSATDATLGDVTATLTVGAVRTDISDLAQRQAAVNLAEVKYIN